MPTPTLDGRTFAAFLFDMDGTLLSSIESAERIWSRWARDHGLDPAALLPTIHGVRTIETMRNLALPGLDPEAEAAWITQAEMKDVTGIHPIAGAARFLAALPRERWAIVTSATRDLALSRLAGAGLPEPPLLLTAGRRHARQARPPVLPARRRTARRGDGRLPRLRGRARRHRGRRERGRHRRRDHRDAHAARWRCRTRR